MQTTVHSGADRPAAPWARPGEAKKCRPVLALQGSRLCNSVQSWFAQQGMMSASTKHHIVGAAISAAHSPIRGRLSGSPWLSSHSTIESSSDRLNLLAITGGRIPPLITPMTGRCVDGHCDGQRHERRRTPACCADGHGDRRRDAMCRDDSVHVAIAPRVPWRSAEPPPSGRSRDRLWRHARQLLGDDGRRASGRRGVGTRGSPRQYARRELRAPYARLRQSSPLGPAERRVDCVAPLVSPNQNMSLRQ